MKRYESWGRYPEAKTSRVEPVYWRDDTPDFQSFEKSVLPYGLGRSYGDSCLNQNGVLLDISLLNKFISFDDEQGVLRCEAGVSLEQALELIVPRGWFLPVTPGTKFVTIAGAIANDVHGKNHHRGGTFGCYVTCFELLRSNGERLLCSATENAELYRATIGGLGLTGMILWAEFKLKPITNSYIMKHSVKLRNLREFFDLSPDAEQKYEYTVAWIDCLASGDKLGRGHYYMGNHAEVTQVPLKSAGPKKGRLKVPMDLPSIFLNKFTMCAFNTTYYNTQLRKTVDGLVHYDPFFYPLDSILEWNRLYGKKGFLQYQCVVPSGGEYEVTKDLLERISRSGQGTFLVVLKRFGEVQSPGIMSFPKPGTTLALDFAFRGPKTLNLLEELDTVVKQCRGAVYPAKDARMSRQNFEVYYPQWKEFEKYIDPKFSSGFWRRVVG